MIFGRAWLQAWWLAHNARCRWCGQYLMPGEPTARTPRDARPIHARCEPAATQDEWELAQW